MAALPLFYVVLLDDVTGEERVVCVRAHTHLDARDRLDQRVHHGYIWATTLSSSEWEREIEMELDGPDASERAQMAYEYMLNDHSFHVAVYMDTHCMF